MTEAVTYLDTDDLLTLATALLGDPPPVRDLGLLGSAAGRPRASAFGEDAYPDLWTKAAAMLQSIVKNHALVDGNKRLGWLATAVFLDINGVAVAHVHNEAVYVFVTRIASRSDNVADIAASSDHSSSAELSEVAETGDRSAEGAGGCELGDAVVVVAEQLGRAPRRRAGRRSGRARRCGRACAVSRKRGPSTTTGPEQRVLDGHVVAAVGELRVGQALGAVLHLVGGDADAPAAPPAARRRHGRRSSAATQPRRARPGGPGAPRATRPARSARRPARCAASRRQASSSVQAMAIQRSSPAAG